MGALYRILIHGVTLNIPNASYLRIFAIHKQRQGHVSNSLDSQILCLNNMSQMISVMKRLSNRFELSKIDPRPNRMGLIVLQACMTSYLTLIL